MRLLYPVLIPLCATAAVAVLARAPRAARALAALAAGVGAVAWTGRWITAGHLPLFGMYEASLSIAVAVLVVAAIRAPLASIVAGLLLLQGIAYDPTAYALTISERSVVVDVHAVLAWVAFAVLTLNFATAIAVWRSASAAGNGGTMATAEKNGYLSATLRWGFILYSAMIGTGAVYKFMLFGTFWSFDPVETLALAGWFAYATILHLQTNARWSDVKLARWCVALFVLLVVSYRTIILFPPVSTYHIFDMNMRIHRVAEGSR